MDFFMSVQGCGRTQSLTTEAAHILLCSAFVHFLVLHECSLRGIFLWTLIASKLFPCIWCLFGAKFILFAWASGNMFLLTLFAANVLSHLGYPKRERRPWFSCICHQTMYCLSFQNGWPSTEHVSKVHWCRCLLSSWVL